MDIFTNLVFDAFTWTGIAAALAAIFIACRATRPGCCLKPCRGDK